MQNILGWTILLIIIAVPVYAYLYPSMLTAFFAGMAMMVWINVLTAFTTKKDDANE